MKYYRLFHFLSLDLVAGALGFSCFAARVFRASPGWAWWPFLAVTVWLVYMSGQLMDAWRHRKTSNREIHRFINKNRRVLLWSLGIASGADLLLIGNFLDRSILAPAAVLAALVLLYYGVRHLLRQNRIFFIPGEIFVVLVFMAGTWMGPLLTRSGELTGQHGMMTLMAGLVLFMNLGIISLYDTHLEKRMGIDSMARVLSKQTIVSIIWVTAVMIFVLLLMQFLIYGMDRYSMFGVILAGMALILLVILLLPSYFNRNRYYRMAADVVLIMGFLSLLVP
ncbi:MAG: hypothetical protein R6U78_14085 [Bacteroidales bacterium]